MEKDQKMEVEDLYGLLPSIDCTPGCIACCTGFGVPSRTRVEDERIRTYLQAHDRELGQAQGTTCPYVSSAGCSIYPVRPLICRLYGNAPSYLCTMGVRPVRLLTSDEEEEIFYLYRKHFF